MFVYNKGKLVRSVYPVSANEFIFRLVHVTSGMTIEVKYNSDNTLMNSPYKVYKEVNDSYVIYEEFYKKNKTIKETFEEAILFFEDNIYKILGETPPQEGTPNPPPPPTPPETFQEVPIVGDIIQVGSKYGVVTDIIDTQVVTKELSKEEAMRILQNQKNAIMSISNAGNTTDDLDFEIPSFDEGGSLSSTIVFDTQKDKIIILRVKPPQPNRGTPPPPDDGQPPQPPEPQPDNVKDPFEETPPKSDKNPQPPNNGKDGEDQDGEDQDREDQDGENEDGENEDGEDQDGENQDGENEDGENQDGENQDGEDSDGEGSDGEFGDDDSDLQSLEEMLKKIKDDFDRGKSTKDIQLEQDLDILENALSTPKDQIKNIFKSKSIALSAIGKRSIFGTDNEQRLNDTLNEIFK
jgi:hypothetical protein